jgi:non-specific serine/threonine protein kinase/serine/threonine-protein kinase
MFEPAPLRDEETGRHAGKDAFAANTSAPTQAAVESGTGSDVVGPYRLLQKIAEGGMGQIWLAEQKQPVRRRVALKLIKTGHDSQEIVRRFESERQALALMDHPAIATVYDAGSTAQGIPYFAMEYVPGVPITTYCETHKLSVRDRIELFIHVCEGVQHAHQKAIIHRDLKPSNILVIEVDGRPAPKIIDFGVAKALSQRLIEQTIYTRIGSVVGTPEYMSPEQADSAGEDIDTRSDVYSLGVILYELLAGVTPIEIKDVTYYEFVRKLRDTTTPKPSTRVRNAATDTAAPEKEVAERRVLLAKELRGDLDCITLKCLEKDRNRRYGSPYEIAADLQRYLHHEPVLATPASAAYRLRKFAERNRSLLLAVCGLIAVLIAGTVVSVYQAVRARRAEHAAVLQRDRADTEAATAAAVNGFLQDDLLSQAGADQQSSDAPPDPDVKVRTLVDRATASVSKKLAGKPMVEADLRSTLGQTYLSLGLLKEAETQMRQSYELNLRTRGPDSPKTIEAQRDLGTVEFNMGNYPEAARNQQAAFDAALRTLGQDAHITLTSMQSLAVDELQMGHADKAEPLLKKVLDRQVSTVGYDDSFTLDTSDSLAFLYLRTGRYAEARQLLERGLTSYRKVYGPDHPNTQREIFGLARVLYSTGDYAKAEEFASTVYKSNLRLMGPTHFKTISVGRELASIEEEEGKLAEAESLMKDTLQKDIRSASDSVSPFYSREALASIYERENKYAPAESLLREAERDADHLLGASNPDVFTVKQLLGENLLHQGKCDEARPFLEDANQGWGKAKSDSWRRFAAQSLLGEALVCKKDFARAEPLLMAGYNGLKAKMSQMPAYEQMQTKRAAERLAQLYSAWDKPEQEAKWRATVAQL